MTRPIDQVKIGDRVRFINKEMKNAFIKTKIASASVQEALEQKDSYEVSAVTPNKSNPCKTLVHIKNPATKIYAHRLCIVGKETKFKPMKRL